LKLSELPSQLSSSTNSDIGDIGTLPRAALFMGEFGNDHGNYQERPVA
jgi:hypothetical protein